MNINVRDAAFITLDRIERGKKYSNIELDSMIKKFGLSGVDKSFFTKLVYGCIERKITLDYIIGRFSSKKVNEIDREILDILRLGVYQIMFLDRVPDNAACNESVELCKIHKFKAGGFVNAVLRELCRKKETITYPSEPMEYLSVKYSYQEWLCEMWSSIYGYERTESLFRAMNEPAMMSLRVNTLKISRDELLNRLLDREIKAALSEISDFGINLLQNYAVSDLPEIEEGLCFIQDEASQLCVALADLKSGEIVIDMCAAPGGKSFSAAIEMRNLGELYSFDLRNSKISLIENGASRLGIDIITVGEKDGTVFDSSFAEFADCVICDVPCSGLGVIAKKPDIRYKDYDSVQRLPEVQYAVLCNAAKYVKSGGRLIYSTCTLNPAENESVVKRFIENSKRFEFISEKTLFPDIDNTDGFYMAKLYKL
jgi:ribosomal RNA small subunit methyltransferase RsmB